MPKEHTIQNDKPHTRFQDFFVSNSQLSVEQFEHELTIAIQSIGNALKHKEKAGPGATPKALEHHVRNICRFSNNSMNIQTILERHARSLINHSAMPNQTHCAAHLHCPVNTTAIVAEIFISTLNQSLDSWDQAPIATHMETHFIQWFANYIGYKNSQPDGVFTSGGTQSNLSALMLARDTSMANADKHCVSQNGLNQHWHKYKVFCSADAHFTIERSCSLLGLGSSAVTMIATDKKGRMNAQSLKQALKQCSDNGDIPMAIVATAGTTDLGAIDPLMDIAQLAREYTCWLHVDAAYGGALLLSNHREKMQGIEHADSVTIDFHKMFFQPISCGALFVRDTSLLVPLYFNADYLNRKTDSEPNLVEKSLSTTRRFDALKIWMSLERFGLDYFSMMIDHLIDLSYYCAQSINNHEELTLYRQPELTTVLFRYSHHNDNFQKNIRKNLLYSGDAVIAETKKNNRIYLKLTLLNPCTSYNDIDTLINSITDCAKESLAENTYE